jgi:alginate O-acetyltransferase complex protein AlgI
MNFISQSYGVFLLILILLYWGLANFFPKFSQLKISLILIFSIVFYRTYQDNFLIIILLFLILLINFCLGLILTPHKKNEDLTENKDFWATHKPILLSIGITFNVLLLLGFKYIPFFLNSIGALFNLPIALDGANWISNNFIIPLGLSFFTFENLAYLIDVYRGAPPANNFLSFAGYKFFFPKLISGPITRYHTFAHQLKNQKFPPFEEWIEGLWLIACGAVKKALIADHLGIFVDLSFNNLERAGSFDLWLTIIAYGLQLYLDFSGYVDMARGSAKLLGLNLPENFDFPYFTTSIAQFWRHWHITLGDWLRNYLYFPLGGSRKGLFRTCFNLFLVMLIAGIWHGASNGYILWGAIHGIGLVIHRLTVVMGDYYEGFKKWWLTIPGIICAWLITQLMVFTSWISFRLPNVSQAGIVYQHLFNYNGDIQFLQKVYTEALGIDRPYVTLLLFLIIVIMSLIYLIQRCWKMHLNYPLKILLVPLCLYLVWIFAPEGVLPYIYFDF